MDKHYVDTVRLLLETAPVVFAEPKFAMKGGTAINLFLEDMPRLSVDIDVVYTDHDSSRRDAMETIAASLERIRTRLLDRGLEADWVTTGEGEEIKLFIKRGRFQVKVEVNHVFRGTLLDVESQQLVDEARSTFATELKAPVLASAELYGSKLVAALDRQHPRDLFDICGMYRRNGLTSEIVECFVCYLAGHNRPVHEVLFSRDIDISPAFKNEFAGMMREPVVIDRLLEIRERLRRDLRSTLTSNHRRFLLSLVRGEPDWSLMVCPHLEEMPALRWKLKNLGKLKKSNSPKFAKQTNELIARLGE